MQIATNRRESRSLARRSALGPGRRDWTSRAAWRRRRPTDRFDDREWSIHDVADRGVERLGIGQPTRRERRFGYRAQGVGAVHDRKLRDIVQRHETDRLPDGRARRDAHERWRDSVFHIEDVRQGDAIGVEQLVLTHPLVAVQLREIALAGIAQECHDARIGIVDPPCDLQRYVRDETDDPPTKAPPRVSAGAPW